MKSLEYGKIISKNLKRIAYEHQKTQADIARDLNIKQATLSSWMNGTRIPRMDKIDLLCQYFNCNRADLMEPHESDTTSDGNYYLNSETRRIAQTAFEDRNIRALFDAAEGCDPEALQLAIDMLKRMKGV